MRSGVATWSMTAPRRLTRRRALGAAAGVAATAFAVACGDDRDSPGSSSGAGGAPGAATAQSRATEEGQPVRGGDVVFGQSGAGAMTREDPHATSQSVLWYHIGNLALDVNKQTFEVVPELVQSWEQVSPTELIFKVRPNVKLHNRPPSNGRTLNAEDIAYNLKRITGTLDPANAARYLRRSVMGPFNRAEAVDASTVRIVLDQPYSPFLSGVADFRNLMVPKDFAETVGFDDPEKFVGTGGYILDTFRPGERAVFRRNPEYWRGADAPYFDQVRWIWLPDESAQSSAYATGQIDWIEALSKSTRETIQALARGATPLVYEANRLPNIRFNPNRAPFTDVRVRRAIQLALDYKEMNDLQMGEGFWTYSGPLSSAYPAGTKPDAVKQLPGWNPATKEQDIKQAKDLMTAAGFPDGGIAFSITTSPPGNTGVLAVTADMVIRAQDQLKKVWPNMQVTVETLQGQAHTTRMTNGEFQLVAYSYVPTYDPVVDLQQNYGTGGSRNYGKYSNPTLDRTLDAAILELDAAKRAELLRSAERTLLDDMPLINFARWPAILFPSPKIRGFKSGAAGGGPWDIYITGDRYWKTK